MTVNRITGHNAAPFEKIFFCTYRVVGVQILSSPSFIVVAYTQYFHTTEHTYTRLIFVVSLVENEFSSKYCCVVLITVTNSVLTYHHH